MLSAPSHRDAELIKERKQDISDKEILRRAKLDSMFMENLRLKMSREKEETQRLDAQADHMKWLDGMVAEMKGRRIANAEVVFYDNFEEYESRSPSAIRLTLLNRVKGSKKPLVLVLFEVTEVDSPDGERAT